MSLGRPAAHARIADVPLAGCLARSLPSHVLSATARRGSQLRARCSGPAICGSRGSLALRHRPRPGPGRGRLLAGSGITRAWPCHACHAIAGPVGIQRPGRGADRANLRTRQRGIPAGGAALRFCRERSIQSARVIPGHVPLPAVASYGAACGVPYFCVRSWAVQGSPIAGRYVS